MLLVCYMRLELMPLLRGIKSPATGFHLLHAVVYMVLIHRGCGRAAFWCVLEESWAVLVQI